jgi:hypothetical protein
LALYNLNEDIGEQNNLIAEEPQKAEELQKKFDLWLQEMQADHANYSLWKATKN